MMKLLCPILPGDVIRFAISVATGSSISLRKVVSMVLELLGADWPRNASLTAVKLDSSVILW